MNWEKFFSILLTVSITAGGFYLFATGKELRIVTPDFGPRFPAS